MQKAIYNGVSPTWKVATYFKMVKSLGKDIGELPAKAPAPADNILDLFSLKGKFASVTGASGGIGLAVAESFAQAGADVALWYNSNPAVVEKAEQIAKENGVKVKAYKCSVTDEAAVKATIEQQLKDFGGKLDIFVANAGATHTAGDVVDDASENWHKIIDVNLNGVYYAAKYAGQQFKKQGFGSFIMTASMSGSIVNVPQMQALYNTSKAALIHFAKSLAVEWAGFARVNTVSPGYTVTDITNFASPEVRAKWWQLTPLGREATPQEIAGAYLYLASDASTFTTGANLVVDGGYSII